MPLVLTAAQCHQPLTSMHMDFLTSLLCGSGLNPSQQCWPATMCSAGPFKNWMDDYFRKALTWAQSRASAVDTSQLGLVQNALTHLHGAVSKRNFACGLARGFGANMAPEHREELAAEVGRWTGEASLLVPAMDISEMLRWALLVAYKTASSLCPPQSMSLGRWVYHLYSKLCLCLSSAQLALLVAYKTAGSRCPPQSMPLGHWVYHLYAKLCLCLSSAQWALLVAHKTAGSRCPPQSMSLGHWVYHLYAKLCLCLSSPHAQYGCHESNKQLPSNLQACMLHSKRLMAVLQAAGRQQRGCCSP